MGTAQRFKAFFTHNPARWMAPLASTALAYSLPSSCATLTMTSLGALEAGTHLSMAAHGFLSAYNQLQESLDEQEADTAQTRRDRDTARSLAAGSTLKSAFSHLGEGVLVAGSTVAGMAGAAVGVPTHVSFGVARAVAGWGGTYVDEMSDFAQKELDSRRCAVNSK